MTSKIGGQSKIIIPALLNNFHPQISAQEDRDMHQEEKMAVEPKIFLAPKHQSRPLALTMPLKQNSTNPCLKFTPSFQNFDLSLLFSNKQLNQKQAAAFSNNSEEDNPNYLTPVRQSRQDGDWSSFKMVDSHFVATADSMKNQRNAVAQPKKSRPKEKGLRKLSQRAYQIVLKMRSASYKEVANKLVDQLNSQKELDQEGKDEQNIKRRVYDALNVLIALGVLRKEGRKIVGDRGNQISFEQTKASGLSLEIQSKKIQLLRKKQKIKQLQERCNMYKQLAETNMSRTPESQVIPFPFLALYNQNPTKITPVGELSQEGHKLTLEWAKSEKDRSFFDVELLVNYQRKKQAKMEQR